MRVLKVLNNNVVLALDDSLQEVIVMGKGIGFQRKREDWIRQEEIEKYFVLLDNLTAFQEVYEQLPANEIDLVFELVSLAEKELRQQFHSNIYITLADHIHYALERHREGIVIQNPLEWEIKRFYPAEYAVGVKGLEIIEKYTDVQLSDSEATSIVLHLINAHKGNKHFNQSTEMIKIVKDIIEIVRLFYGYSFQEDTTSFTRFITHLQFFARRVLKSKVDEIDNDFLFEKVSQSYPKEIECTTLIKKYIKNRYDFDISLEEQSFLAIHIRRLVMDYEEKKEKNYEKFKRFSHRYSSKGWWSRQRHRREALYYATTV